MKVRGRPGKGSTKPANVKLRPILAPEDRATPRSAHSSLNHAPIPRQEVDEWSDGDGDGDGEQDVDERKPLEGMRLTSTGKLESANREEVRRMCSTLGATFEPVLAADATFLLADRTWGDKYRAAVDNGIPVLHSSFLKDVHARWVNADPNLDVAKLSEQHRLAPLHDLTICLTGYSTSREDLRTKISALGGAAYSPNLDSKVTHLVLGPAYMDWKAACSEEAGKVAAARKINAKRRTACSSSFLGSSVSRPGSLVNQQATDSAAPVGSAVPGASSGEIHIVWGEWLEHSLIAFGRQDERRYTCSLVQSRENLGDIRIKRTMDIVQRAKESPRKSSSTSRRKRGIGGTNDEVPVKILRYETGHDLSEAGRSVSMSVSEQPPAQAQVQPGSKKRRIAEDDAEDDQDTKMASAEGAIDNTAQEQDGKIDAIDSSGITRRTRDRTTANVAAHLGTTASSSSTTSAKARPSLRKNRSSARAEMLGVQDLLAPAPSTSISTSTSLATSTSASATIIRKRDLPTPSSNPVTSSSLPSTREKGKKRAFDGGNPVAAANGDEEGAKGPSGLLSNFAKTRSSRFTSTSSTSNSLAAVASRATAPPPRPVPLAGDTSLGLNASGFLDVSVVDHPARTDSEQGEEEEEEEDVGIRDQMFEGKKFQLRLPVSEGHEIFERVKESILIRGGSLVKEDGPSVDYIIYKFAQTKPLDIDLTDPRIFTDVWLESCLAYAEIINPQAEPGNLLIKAMSKPLHGKFPLLESEAGKYHISYAGFADPEKSHLTKFCDALGLRNDGFMKRGHTHLIIPNAEYASTKRLASAQNWGITVVYPDWLKNLAVNGLQEQGKEQISATKMEELEEDPEFARMDLDDDRNGGLPEQVDEIRSDHGREGTGPLVGCKIAIHRELETKSLKDLVFALGATYVHSAGPHSDATHFIYRSKRLKDPNREFKAALSAGQIVVHPAWLEACAAQGERLPEQACKWTMDVGRSLSLGLEGSQGPGGRRASLREGSAATSEAATERATTEEGEEEFSLPPPLVARSAPVSKTVSSGLQRPSRVFSHSAHATAQLEIRGSSTGQLPLPRSPPPPPTHIGPSSVKRSISDPQVSPARKPLSFAVSHPQNSSIYTTAPAAAALDEPIPFPMQRGEQAMRPGNDSGFVPSSTEKNRSLQLQSSPQLYGSGDVTIPSFSSPGSGPRERVISTSSNDVLELGISANNQITAREEKTSSSSDPDTQQGVSQHPSSTAVNRDIIAEMHALMADQHAGAGDRLIARLPNQQIPGIGGLAGRFRRSFVPNAKRDTSGTELVSPALAKSTYIAPTRYEGLFESQLAGGGFSQQGFFQESSSLAGVAGVTRDTVITISDPSAEAAKARLLADIGAATTAAGDSIAGAPQEEDSDATQKSSSGAESLEARGGRRSSRLLPR